MRKQLQQVGEFMETFEQRIRLIPTLPENMEESLLRVKLLREEVDELEAAILAGDIVEVADAITDIAYINTGNYHTFGLVAIAEPLFNEVQRSNMSKLDEEGKVLRREDGKIMKSNLYSQPDLESIVNNTVMTSDINSINIVNYERTGIVEKLADGCAYIQKQEYSVHEYDGTLVNECDV